MKHCLILIVTSVLIINFLVGCKSGVKAPIKEVAERILKQSDFVFKKTSKFFGTEVVEKSGDDFIKLAPSLNKRLLKYIEDYSGKNKAYITKLANDLLSNPKLLSELNKNPALLDAYNKVSNTWLRTDVKYLRWINTIDRNIEKPLDQSCIKTLNRLIFKENKDGVVEVMDGEVLVATIHKPNHIIAKGGNKLSNGKIQTKDTNPFLTLKNIPNSNYVVDNTRYLTDNHGRVEKVSANLELYARGRNSTFQRQASNNNGGLETDQGGHLIAQILGGPVEHINIVPMSSKLNQGSWKAMENELASLLKSGKKIDIDISLFYPNNKLRPHKINVIAMIDGVPKRYSFLN